MEEKEPDKKKKRRVIIGLIEQALFMGIGLAVKTKDEVRELAKDFVKKAELSENEGKKFINDFLKRYDKSREKLEEKVEKTVKDVFRRSSLATKDDLADLKAEIEKPKKTSAE